MVMPRPVAEKRHEAEESVIDAVFAVVNIVHLTRGIARRVQGVQNADRAVQFGIRGDAVSGAQQEAPALHGGFSFGNDAARRLTPPGRGCGLAISRCSWSC